MTTSGHLVLLSILILSFIFLFGIFCNCKKKKTSFTFLFIYLILYVDLFLFGYFIKHYCMSFALPFLICWAGSGDIIPSNSGSGPSRSTPCTEDSFEIKVLMEPFSETEMMGTSARSSIPRDDEATPSSQSSWAGSWIDKWINRGEVGSSIPRVADDEAHQGAVVQNTSLESSIRNRIVRLEQNNSPYLLDKGKGQYWGEIKQELDHASSQREYNRVLDFENRDLQIRERKNECFHLYKEVLAKHPTLADQTPYNPQEVFDDFLNHHRGQLDQQELHVEKNDHLELRFLDLLRQRLKENGPAYVRKIFFD